MIAPGNPKRRVPSFSAATFTVLTRFTRTRPTDLGHVKASAVYRDVQSGWMHLWQHHLSPPHRSQVPGMNKTRRV